MSFAETVALGAVAGFTIYIGLPVGRLRLAGDKLRVALAMLSVGVLAFIFVDVLSNGLDIVHGALDHFKHDHGSFLRVFGYVVLLGGGFTAGSAGLAFIERQIRPSTPRPPIAGGA